MKKIDIAKAHGVQPIFVTMLIRGDRKTTIIPLAIDIAKFTGTNPLDFLSERKGFKNFAKIHYRGLDKNYVHKQSLVKKA